MKVVYGAAIAISLIIVLTPTASGLISSAETFDQQMADYEDDGDRYVIAQGLSADSYETSLLSTHQDALMLLTDRFATSDNDVRSGPGSYQTVITAWKQLAKLREWTAEVLEGRELRTLIASPEEAVYVALLDRSGVAVPFLVADADSIFVTAYEANTGKVLFRRNAFIAAWSGLTLELKPLVAGRPR